MFGTTLGGVNFNGRNMNIDEVLPGLPKIVGGLLTQPGLGRRLERHLQTQRHLWCNRAAPIEYLGKCLTADTKMPGSGRYGHAQGVKNQFFNRFSS